MRPGAWPVLLCVICGCSLAESAKCGDQASCHGGRLLECVQVCKSGLATKTNGTFVKSLLHISPSESDTSGSVRTPTEDGTLDSMTLGEGRPKGNEEPSARKVKRSYPMEHFRWGKPGGRKRRPVKVYSNGMEEDLSEAYPTDMRRQLPEEADYTLEEDQELADQKDGGFYETKQFRWAGLPASKRYGGFMKSWGGHSQKSLMTLFKNIINKNGHW